MGSSNIGGLQISGQSESNCFEGKQYFFLNSYMFFSQIIITLLPRKANSELFKL